MSATARALVIVAIVLSAWPATTLAQQNDARTFVEEIAVRRSDLPADYQVESRGWEGGTYIVRYKATGDSVVRGPMVVDSLLENLPNADMAGYIAGTFEIGGTTGRPLAVDGTDVARIYDTSEPATDFTLRHVSLVFARGPLFGFVRVQGEETNSTPDQALALAMRIVGRAEGRVMPNRPAFALGPIPPAALRGPEPPTVGQPQPARSRGGSSVASAPPPPSDSDLAVTLESVNTLLGRNFPIVAGRACNAARGWTASSIRIEFEFYYDSLLPTLDSGSHRVSEVTAGDCRRFEANLSALQPWRKIAVRRVTWDWEPEV